MPGARRNTSKKAASNKPLTNKEIGEAVSTAEIVEMQKKEYAARGRAITREQWVIFFTMLAQTAHVTRSCDAAAIDRNYVYTKKSHDPEFESLFEQAINKGRETLLEEAQRRAFDGYNKPVFQGGMQVGIIREYSDSLAAFLLKGYMPKLFKDRTENVNLNVDATNGLSEDELRQAVLDKLNGSSPAPKPTSGEEQA